MKRREFLRNCVRVGAGGFILGSTAGAGTLLSNGVLDMKLGPRPGNLFPQLDKFGDNFKFTLVADPQLDTATTIGNVGGTSSVRYDEMINEMNSMQVRPAFSILDGDLVNVPTSSGSWDNFMDSTLSMKFLPILVYGNHDGNSNTGYYELFKDKQEQCNNTREIMFSFDCGKWHFIVIHCDVRVSSSASWPYPDQDDVIAFLNEDLRRNRNKPTMIFGHEHLVPQGLTQLEWYTYDRTFRKRLLDAMGEYGNVRYFINGHVHNGIKASIKTAWTYKGIKFITAPTCTASRPFGEEFPEFTAGEDQGTGDTGGGYYMEFDVKGEDVVVTGRLANIGAERVYTENDFPEYTGQDPIWFKQIIELPVSSGLVNGSFESGLDGWTMPYRYVADSDPMFYWNVASARSKSGGHSLHLRTHESGQPWAQTEMLEQYQLVEAGNSPLLKFSYYLQNAGIGGGGYVRIIAFDEGSLKLLFQMDFNASSSDKRKSDNMGKNTTYYTNGVVRGARGLILLGEEKKGMYWTLPSTAGMWHDVTFNFEQLFGDIWGNPSAWSIFKCTPLQIAFGSWTLAVDGSRNDVWYDDISLTQASGETSNVDGTPLTTNSTHPPVSGSVYYTEFGRNF